MAAKRIIDVAKELIEEQIVSYIEPSEQKVASAKRKVEEAKMNLKKAEENAKNQHEKWQQLKKEFAGKINSNKVSINNFKKKLSKAGTKTKARYEEKLNDLENRNKKMMVKIGKYKDERAEKWEAFKTVFMHDMEEI